MISKTTREGIYMSITLFISLLILVSAYVMEGSKYGMSIKYLAFVFGIWVIGLSILHLVFKYIIKNTDSSNTKIILYIIMFILSIGCIISVSTGYVISIGATSYYALLGYLAGLTMIIPELQYFGYFLYKLCNHNVLCLHPIIDITIMAIGLYYSVVVCL